MPDLTPAAGVVFSMASDEAQQLASANIEPEHIFLGLCKVDRLKDVTPEQMPSLSNVGISQIREEVEGLICAIDFVGLNMVRARRRLRLLWQETHPNRERFSGHRAERSREVFVNAERDGKGVIDLASLMISVLGIQSPLLDELLAEFVVTRESLVEAVRQCTKEPARSQDPVADRKNTHGTARYGRDLTELALQGKLHPAIGRDDEIKRIARILIQAKKNNPMLVGDAGVGKTAIVEALALKLADARISPTLRHLRIIELSLGALVAGTKLRGEFEERLESIIRECEADSSLVIFIDEIHVILGAGSAGGAMDAANLLKPALARGGMRCIGATTPSEYRQYIERDAALERRFQVVWIEEPSSDVTIRILEQLRPRLEEHHHVEINSEALQKAVELANRYLPEFRLPDKAIDIIDQACARAGLETLSPVTGPRSTASHVGVEDVAAIISERCRVPIQRLTVDEGQRLLKMEEVLCQRVIGQEHAVSAVAEAIRVARTGIRDPKRPLSVLLFLGPTGVGKTELAKAVAEFLFDDDRRLIRIDMSEYSEKHSIAKLIGSPPGYIGHDEGGQLTDKVRTCPYSVVLFDEIEKAHDEVFNLFLQIFDEGRLTDSRGRTADFRETVIVMTSNLGSRSNRSQERHPIGFAVGNSAEDPSRRERDLATYDQRFRLAVEQALPAELRNRIQKQIIFRPLSRGAIEDIIDKIVSRLNSRLLSQGISVNVNTTAKAALMLIGYSEELGARAMERAIHDHIEEPLARMLLEDRMSPGQRVEVTGKDGLIHLSFT